MSINIKIIGWNRSDKTADMLIRGISGLFVQKISVCPSSYVKIDKVPILDMGLPDKYDYLIVLDTGQASLGDYKAVKQGGVVVVNTQEKIGASISNAVKKAKAKIVTLDATGISIEHTGKPDPSIGILACFVRNTNLLSLKSMEDAIKASKAAEGALAIAEQAHKL